MSSQVIKCFSKTPVKITGLCGSLRSNSFTKLALKHCLEGSKSVGSFIQTELIDLNDFNLFLCDGLPNESKYTNETIERKNVNLLKSKLQESKGIILGTPEYHGSMSGVLKNSLDLCGFDEFESKIIGLVGVSGGAMGCLNGLEQLRTICRSLHCWVCPDQVSIPYVWKVFDINTQQFNSNQQNIKNRLYNVGKVVASYATLHSNQSLNDLMDHFIKGQANYGLDNTSSKL